MASAKRRLANRNETSQFSTISRGRDGRSESTTAPIFVMRPGRPALGTRTQEQKMQTIKTVAIIAALGLGLSSAAIAGPDTNTTGGLALDGTGLAMHGYDAVAYFTNSEPVIGSADHSATYNDATYRFSNEENLKKFTAEPAKYAPQYGGYCAFGASFGKKFDGDPRYWTIVDGKLYLNHSGKVLERWRKKQSDRIAAADKHWPEIARRTPAELQ